MIDHTADFGIHVFGSDSKTLFSNAVVAMFDLLTNINSLKGREYIDLEISGEDWADLMVNWLRETLFLWNGREMLVKTASIQSLTQQTLSAKVTVDPYDPERHAIKTEIKAVTYHQIQVYRNPAGWEAKIIFDV
ncbi:MAG: archease [Desulfobacterales bacterium]|nr:MAG: archease [Desulfobacterales bacterium]